MILLCFSTTMIIFLKHHLSNAKPCDGKIAQDFSIWLEEVSRTPTSTCKDPKVLL